MTTTAVRPGTRSQRAASNGARVVFPEVIDVPPFDFIVRMAGHQCEMRCGLHIPAAEWRMRSGSAHRICSPYRGRTIPLHAFYASDENRVFFTLPSRPGTCAVHRPGRVSNAGA